MICILKKFRDTNLEGVDIMLIDQEKCVGCGTCLPFCPVEAIQLKARENSADADKKKSKKFSIIVLDECAECGVCLRSAGCPQDAIYQQPLEYPRTIRSLMSDVLTVAQESQISGRGTEEMKTNEVTGRFKKGFTGVGIEVGRAITGARIRDVEKIAMAVAKLNIEFEKVNPTTSMMSDPATGRFKNELLNEKVLSAILEFCVKNEQLPELFDILGQVAKEIDSVFSLDIATRLDSDGANPTRRYIDAAGLWVAPNGKTNVALGRPLIQED
jgi:NAD-dependent dihydropyrimidine dehydrogenase PreA subunit